MILVAGLGNPGPRYAETRHNVGFMVADELARRASASAWRHGFSGLSVTVCLAGERVGLLKPTTYMNDSGRSVAAAVAFFKIDVATVVVIHDELDLPFGVIRLKVGGGDAGHKGLKSVSRELGSSDYTRVRVGIGRPPDEFPGTAADFVLQAFAPAEQSALQEHVGAAADAVVLTLGRGLAAAMNATNQRAKP